MDCRQQKGPAEHRAAAKRTQVGQNMEATRACYSTDYLVTLVSASVTGPFVRRSVSPERSVRPGNRSSGSGQRGSGSGTSFPGAEASAAAAHLPLQLGRNLL